MAKNKTIDPTVSISPKAFKPFVTISKDPYNPSGTGDYNDLSNKPSINGVTLIGDKTADDLELQEEMDFLTDQEIDQIIFGTPTGVPFVPMRMGIDLRTLIATDVQ